MKGTTIEYYHGSLVRKTIPSKDYDSIFNLRRNSKSITKNKFRLSLNKYNAMCLYFSLMQQSKNDHKCFHNHKNMSILDYSIFKSSSHVFSELRMAKDYFDKNCRRI